MSGCFGNSQEDKHFEKLSLCEFNEDYIIIKLLGDNDELFDFETELTFYLNQMDFDIDIDIVDNENILKIEIYFLTQNIDYINNTIDDLLQKYNLELM